MHRFHSRRSLFRFRLGSITFLLFFLAILALIPAVVWVVFLEHREDYIYPLIALGAAVLTWAIYLVVGAGIRCPLCHGHLLGNPRCSRSNKARRFLGSYRLGVALPALMIGRFRCPCCGEPCQCNSSRP